MAKPLAELKRLQRNQLLRVNKDDLIDSILASSDDDENSLLRALSEKVETLVAEVSELKNAVTSPSSMINSKFKDMQAQIDKQAEIIAKHQKFMEVLDRKERERNLVILSVPDEHESLDGATSDEEKIEKIWRTIEVNENVISQRRLGNRNGGNRKRPILVTMASKESKERVLAKASKLKTSNDIYSRIFIKKDVHPAIRSEWKRLREAEAVEKDRPENAGCTIHLDTRERKLLRDGVVIDSFSPSFFL